MANRYTLHLPERPFRAIQNRTKKVEGRAGSEDGKYKNMSAGDEIVFINEATNEEMVVVVRFVHHYKDVKTMLEAEDPKKVLSSFPKTVEHGIESYHSLEDYKERVEKYGIYAIGIEPK